LKEKDLVVEEEVVVSKVVVQKDRDHLVDHQVTVESIVMEIVWANRKEFQDQHSNFLFFFINSRTGSSFRSTAGSFAAGAAGGIAAYSLMNAMSGSYRSRPGYYEPGYGGKFKIDIFS
jgi:hypothetical protein